MIFVLIEPTHGVDVAARAEIYRRLEALAAAGKALVVVSSEIPEMLALADRILVLRDGRIVAETTPAETDEERLNLLIQGAAMSGPAVGRCPLSAYSADRHVGTRIGGLRFAVPRSASGILASPAQPMAARRRSCCFVAFAATSPIFGSLGNAENILRQTAPVLLLGLGMSLVVLVGGIDLSVGSVVIASAVAAGIALLAGLPSAVAMVAAVAIGAGVGAINALLIEALRISPVIVTLGSMIAVRGLALVALGEYSSWITIKAPAFDALAKARVVGLPLDALIVLVPRRHHLARS